MKTIIVSTILTLLLIFVFPSEEPIKEYPKVDVVLDKCEKNIERAHKVNIVADIQQRETMDSLQKIIISLQREKQFLERNIKRYKKDTSYIN